MKYEEGGTYVIPGRGRLCDEADVVEFRNMVTIVRDRVRDLDRQRQNTGASEGGPTHARLRHPIRREVRRRVRGGHLQKSDRQEMTMRIACSGTTHVGDRSTGDPTRAAEPLRPPKTPQGGCADRLDWILGLRHFRGLALAHGHACQGAISPASPSRPRGGGSARLGIPRGTKPPATSATLMEWRRSCACQAACTLRGRTIPL